MNREYLKWYSRRLQRDMEMLVFGHAGARLLVFPTRAGRFYDYEDWGMVHALSEHIEQGWVQLFCIDSVDAESFYCERCHPYNRIRRHQKYEDYIIHEVLPVMNEKNPNPFIIAHGCSLGAYHAMNITLRHPDLFKKVVAFSGRYDLTQPMGWFRDLFDGYYDDLVYFHTPCHYIPLTTDPHLLEKLRRLEIIFAVGEEDAFADNNRHLSHLLRLKEISHNLHIWAGEAHKPRYWRRMVVQYV
ncbi:MAG: esterase family protein [Blastochloris sp.]|nr:esterase family protein [Blastochloris sp.]